MTWLTDPVLHDLRVVSGIDGVGKPAQAELEVPLGSFYVFGAVDVHGFPPIAV